MPSGLKGIVYRYADLINCYETQRLIFRTVWWIQTCCSLNFLALEYILTLDRHWQIFLGTFIRIRKIPLKCSCSDLVFHVTEGFISTSADFKPRRGILVICENETVKFYLSSYLFLGHPCAERRKQFSQPLLWTFSFTDSKLVECAPDCLLTEISHTELAHSKSLLLLSVMKLQCPSQWYRISSWNGLKAIWKCGILY